MYYGTVELNKDNSFEMRKMLAQRGFSIYLMKEWDKHIDLINVDCDIIYMDDTVWYKCIYNDTTRDVPDELVRAVKESFRKKGCVRKYNFGAK